jgi:TatA/E family protein of Tat protein translocase
MASFFAFIDGIGGPELLLIFFLSLMLFGGKKLPELARGLGKSMREFKRAAAGVEQEIKRAIEEPPPVRRPPPAPAATVPVGTVSPSAMGGPLANEPAPSISPPAPAAPPVSELPPVTESPPVTEAPPGPEAPPDEPAKPTI